MARPPSSRARPQAVWKEFAMERISRQACLHPLWLTAFVLVLISSAWAQKDTGSVVGSVLDPSGAVLPNAVVSVADVERGTVFRTHTNSNGEYVASPLKIGRYRVTVEHAGFKRAVSDVVELDVQQRAVVNVQLQIGQTSESVE